MYSRLTFKSWRRDPASGEVFLSFEDRDELTISTALSNIEKCQQSLRDQINQSQDSVEGLSGDGESPDTPIIKPNAKTLKFRKDLTNEIFRLENEKEYIKKLQYLIDNDSLIEKQAYRLLKKGIEKLHKKPKRKYFTPNFDQISLFHLLAKLTPRQWVFIISLLFGLITFGYWIRPFIEEYFGR